MTIKEKEKAFRLHLLEEEKARSTIALYMTSVRQFLDFAGDAPVDKYLTMAYKEQLMERYTAATVNSKIGHLNLFFRFCERPELCLRRLRIQRQLFLPEEKNLSLAEYTRLVKTAEDCGQERTAMAMQILCAAGIRVSELRFITVEAAREGRARVRNKGKTRTVLLPETLREKIAAYAARQKIPTGPVIVSAAGHPLDRTVIWRSMRTMGTLAGVPAEKVHPHALRHLFAMTYYRQNHDPISLADLLGHTSVDTTRIYTAGDGAAQQAQLDGMHLVL